MVFCTTECKLLKIFGTDTVTDIDFDSENLALFLETGRTVGRDEALRDGRQELMTLVGHVACHLDDLAAWSPKVWTRDHLRQRLRAFLQFRLQSKTPTTSNTINAGLNYIQGWTTGYKIHWLVEWLSG